MPRKPSIPSYRLHKARGCAVVTIHGQSFYLGPHDSPESKENYARLIAENFGSDRNGAVKPAAPLDPTGLKVNELILKYWTEHVQHYYVKDGEPTERQGHIRLALAPLRKLYGRTPAEDFGPKKLKAVRDQIIEKGREDSKGVGLNRGYINNHIGIIKRMFRWAVSEEILSREIGPAICAQLNTVENLHKGKDPRVSESKSIPPAPKSAIRIARRFMSPQIRTMVNLQLITGMRPDEVTIMRGCDIERQGEVWIYRPHDHKMDHKEIERVVPLGPRSQKLLNPWLLKKSEGYLFDPRDVVSDTIEKQRVVANGRRRKKPLAKRGSSSRRPREHYDDVTYCRAVTRACKKASVEAWTPGQLRHNAATRVSKKYDRETARQLLGHGSVSTTGIYIEEQIGKAMAAMEENG